MTDIDREIVRLFGKRQALRGRIMNDADVQRYLRDERGGIPFDAPATSLRIRDHGDAIREHANIIDMWRGKGDDLAEGWLAHRDQRYGPDATAPSVPAFAHMMEDLLAVDTLFLTHEMMDFTQHAMAGFDRREEMRPGDVWIPAGLMVLPEPFYFADVHGKRTCWRAIQWRYTDDAATAVDLTDPDVRAAVVARGLDPDAPGQTMMDFSCRMKGRLLPGVRMVVWSHIADEDDYTDRDAPWVTLANRGLRWQVVHASTLPMEIINRAHDVAGEGDRDADWLTFWRVALRLMSERIVAYGQARPPRPAWREALRKGRPPHVPYLVELRRQSVTHRPTDDRSAGREWTHRWIVRGHWRNQWYPSEGRHRQKFIGGYVKGPEDLPLVIRERVWNWNR